MGVVSDKEKMKFMVENVKTVMIENIKTAINFNSTNGKSQLMEYFLEQYKPTKIVIQEFPYSSNVENNNVENKQV